MYSKIADLMYNLFVINRYASAIQQPDGKYITKYFPLTPFVIEEMLKNKGSMGCYQQGYKTDKIKWLCFDFDCPNKQSPDVDNLYYDFVAPFTKVLDELEIHYLTEFSGRRGIHVWIIFDTIISKSMGFEILQALKRKCVHVFENTDIHVDFYPAVATSMGNVVGKQVKLPLSCHRSGARSYLFEGNFKWYEDCFGSDFINSQAEILEKYVSNSVDIVIELLDIEKSKKHRYEYKYKKYLLFSSIEASIGEIEEILSETLVYKNIFDRMKSGLALREDWTVLLGTLSCCDTNCGIVKQLFESFPNYDIQKTLENIKKLSDKYFPATFGYLYEIYNITPEENIDLNETGLSYLAKKLGCDCQIVENMFHLNEKRSCCDTYYTLLKEKNYLLDNDEVPDVIISNQLNNVKHYDLQKMSEEIVQIKKGEWKDLITPNGYVVYERIESSEKRRKMVSLSTKDRLITTQAIIELQSKIKAFNHSFSYNISLCTKDQIFFAWYSSWMNYVNHIKTFLEVPFLDNYYVFTMDIRSFYDNVDFLNIYQALQDVWKDDIEIKNLINFLIAYNENLMVAINDGNRKGVPQGPAYARVIAEIYLDYILQTVFSKFDTTEFHYFRYVDDIVIFYHPGFNGVKLYNTLESSLASFGLHLNQEKSKIIGRIGNITEDDRKLITHQDKFSYELRQEDDFIVFEEEQNRRIQQYLQKNEFDISVVSYIFGKNTLPLAIDVYYKKYAQKIFSESMGRGSYFRRFYNYVLDDYKRIEEALEKGYFSQIPINSLNFSNLINILYLKLQDHSLPMNSFMILKSNYISNIDISLVAPRETTVLKAILSYNERSNDE